MRFRVLLLLAALGAACCAKQETESQREPTPNAEKESPLAGAGEPALPESPKEQQPRDASPPSEASALPLANVTRVRVEGDAGSYRFSVEISSPDRGCQQYANWWEVLRPDGSLVHRRILKHSHVDEQPYTRSGGPIAITADDEVIVRAHMHPGGYGGVALRGRVRDGFTVDESLGAAFAPGLAEAEPQPRGCAF
jgi:hypothetical protein